MSSPSLDQPRFQVAAELYRLRQTEAQFQAAVLEAAGYYGWHLRLRIDDGALAATAKAASTPGRGRGSAIKALDLLRDWPDVLLVHRGRHQALYVEFKTATGAVKEGQMRCLVDLYTSGHDARLWRPQDWDADIDPVLAGRKRDNQGPVFWCAQHHYQGEDRWSVWQQHCTPPPKESDG